MLESIRSSSSSITPSAEALCLPSANNEKSAITLGATFSVGNFLLAGNPLFDCASECTIIYLQLLIEFNCKQVNKLVCVRQW